MKQYARRKLEDFNPNCRDLFVYRSLKEVGDHLFIEALGETMKGVVSRDIDASNPGLEFSGMKKFAGNVFDPTFWEIAYLGDSIIGVVCPQKYEDKPAEGSLFHVGIVPEMRGLGYGKILHAHGMSQLKAWGVKEYVGSTDVVNLAMIQVFLSNDCRLTKIIEVEV